MWSELTAWLRERSGSSAEPNGLLRQYLPKGSDLSIHSPAETPSVSALHVTSWAATAPSATVHH